MGKKREYIAQSSKGIYIMILPNGGFYVGSSRGGELLQSSLSNRRSSHRYSLINGMHNHIFQKNFDKEIQKKVDQGIGKSEAVDIVLNSMVFKELVSIHPVFSEHELEMIENVDKNCIQINGAITASLDGLLDIEASVLLIASILLKANHNNIGLDFVMNIKLPPSSMSNNKEVDLRSFVNENVDLSIDEFDHYLIVRVYDMLKHYGFLSSNFDLDQVLS